MSNRRTAKSDASSAQGSLAFDACGPSVDAAAEARRRESALPRHEVRAAKRVLSYGGGLDSFGMLVDAVARGDKPDLVVFADVTDPERKDPGEWDETYSHIERVARPYCEANGIEFVWLDTVTSPVRGHRSLYAYLKSLRAMVGRMSRMCTVAAKVERVAAYVESRFPEGPIEVWVGFEAGEQDRAEKDPHSVGAKARRGKRARKVQRRTSRFPLIERGLCRCRLVQLIRAAGLEVPPGSACVADDPSRKGPYPLYDVATLLMAARLDPLEREAASVLTSRELATYRKHDPVWDAVVSARFVDVAMNAICRRDGGR